MIFVIAELRQRIGKYLGGDVEALPSIFEAILARKLSGKHEDSDDELMEKFRSKAQHGDEHGKIGLDGDEQIESDEDLSYFDEDQSDLDENLSDSDEELSDWMMALVWTSANFVQILAYLYGSINPTSVE